MLSRSSIYRRPVDVAGDLDFLAALKPPQDEWEAEIKSRAHDLDSEWVTASKQTTRTHG